jgi:hypothetical protein
LTNDQIEALTTDHLDRLIVALLAARQQRNPAIDSPPPNPCTSLGDPKLNTFLDQMQNLSVLQFLHPGAGWMSFALPRKERDHLLVLLAVQKTLPPLMPEGPAQ